MENQRRITREAKIVLEEVNAETPKYILKGCAIRYDTVGKTTYGKLEETIDPKAFDDADLSNVKLVYNHSVNNGFPSVLARSSSGTLKLTNTPEGLFFETELPDTTLGRDLKVLIQRGDLSECSFDCFFDLRTGYKMERKDDKIIGRLTKATVLNDVSIVVDGFYKTTSVNVDVMMRSMEGVLAEEEKNNEAEIKRRASGKALEMRLRILGK